MNANPREESSQIEPAFSKEESLKRKRDVSEDSQLYLDYQRQKIDLESRRIQVTHNRLDLIDKLVARYHDASEACEDSSANNVHDLLRGKVWNMIEDA